MKRDVVYCGVIFLLLAAVCILMSRRPVPEVIETVRVDTVFYERPQPVGISDKLRPIRVPRFLFLKGKTDTVFVNNEQVYTDSVGIAIVRRTVEYADSNYRAVVSGPALGDYGPQLDRFEVYPRTVTRTQTVTKRPRFAVTAGPGVAYTPQGLQLTLGINAGFVLWSK